MQGGVGASVVAQPSVTREGKGLVYNVFVDDPVTGVNVDIMSSERAYDASALANAFVDAGYRVDTDLWANVVWDAMVSPTVWERYALHRYPALLTAQPETEHTCGPGINWGCDAPGCDGDVGD